jgi:hypothetical protein
MRPLTADDAWYFDSYDIEWWLGNLFDMAVEVHSFQLGLFVGILLGILAVQDSPKTLALSLALLVTFLLGAFEGTLLCANQTQTCTHIQLKPWYFLGGIVITKLSVVGVHRKLATGDTSLLLRFGSKE